MWFVTVLERARLLAAPSQDPISRGAKPQRVPIPAKNSFSKLFRHETTVCAEKNPSAPGLPPAASRRD
jgi:hypothetical protein